MSLYERVDRDLAPRRRPTIEFALVYAVCFVAMLLPATLRRLGGHSTRSLFTEARTMAASCAAAAFMGM